MYFHSSLNCHSRRYFGLHLLWLCVASELVLTGPFSNSVGLIPIPESGSVLPMEAEGRSFIPYTKERRPARKWLKAAASPVSIHRPCLHLGLLSTIVPTAANPRAAQWLLPDSGCSSDTREILQRFGTVSRRREEVRGTPPPLRHLIPSRNFESNFSIRI